jgi:hypothetical protein
VSARLPLWLGTLALLASAPLRAEEPAPEARAFVEVVSPRETWRLGEAVEVRVRVAYDAAWLAERGVALVPHPMDLPLEVRAPWLDAPPGTALAAPAPPASAARRSFVLGDEVVRGVVGDEAVVGGRVLDVVEVERRFVPEAAGSLVLAGPTLRFAWASAFEEDFVGGRTAVDRREVVLTGAPLRLVVEDARPVPPAPGPGSEATTPTRAPEGPPTAAEEDPSPAWVLGVLALPLVAVGLLLLARRRRAPAPPGPPAPVRALAPPPADARPEAVLAAPEDGRAAAFAAFLAARLGCAPAAVVAPDLAGRLERAGVPAALAAHAAEALEQDVARRYGAAPGPSAIDGALVRALADALPGGPRQS